jgi:hypothetical protein
LTQGKVISLCGGYRGTPSPSVIATYWIAIGFRKDEFFAFSFLWHLRALTGHFPNGISSATVMDSAGLSRRTASQG